MNSGRTVFAQVMEFLPLPEFRTCVARYQGEYKVRGFSCLDQFLCLAFAQLTYRESLRDIETCLRAMQPRLYHMGIRGRVARSTLADANETRDWRIYADFAQTLIGLAKSLYATEPFSVDLAATVYAFDSTTIDLCLALFPWARFRQHKGAIKLHTLLNLRGNIPEVVAISDGKWHDVKALDLLLPLAGAYYVLDRGYLDFARLYRFHQAAAFFVTRAKANLQFGRRYSHPVDKTTGIRCDQTIVLTGPKTATLYPVPLRRIRYTDPDTGKHLVFLTNDVTLPALTIAQLYKSRWQVELFFKWIKQHLRIKAFYGTSANAVKTQVWIAVSIYVLVAILKKRLGLPQSLYTILQVLSVTLFERMPLIQALTIMPESTAEDEGCNQLLLFDR
ncbi:MAG: IS4 family transposase [bacterium]|uniref:IS4 family transposase n=1 Tax=Candidatus Methylomirabilis tolerans TaxID=3123416 RepID=A0AAJ1AH20_9BACT|nr:IS4 family transposase [Candidatus Methylomirabilis sp.]